jgi:hypothetical protein
MDLSQTAAKVEQALISCNERKSDHYSYIVLCSFVFLFFGSEEIRLVRGSLTFGA